MKEQRKIFLQKLYISLLFVVLLIVTGLNTHEVRAATLEQTWQNLTWLYDESGKVLIISGNGDMPTSGFPWTNLMTDNGKGSTQSGEPNIDKVKHIIIDDGVTSIASGAFSADNTIQTITIGSGVTNIKSNAFNCTETTFICNGATSDQSIESNAFAGLSKTCEVQYTRANNTFASLVKNNTGTKTFLNEKGYVSIAGSGDWYNNLIDNGKSTSIYGRYELLNGFDFYGTYRIVTKSIASSNYGEIIDVSYVNKNFFPYTIEVNSGSKVTTRSVKPVSFYGVLNGNGNKISKVKYGLFTKNHGIIKNTLINSLSSTSNPYEYPSKEWTNGTVMNANGSVCHINYGIIDSIEIDGALCGSPQMGTGSTDYEPKWDKNLPGGGVSGLNYGTIRKCQVNINLLGRTIGGISAKNYGTIFGCSVEGRLLGENTGPIHNGTRNNRTEPYVGGISYENTGLIEQCYAGANIIGYACFDDNEANVEAASNGVFINARLSSLAFINSGTIKNCSTGGFLNLMDSSYIYQTIESDRQDKVPGINVYASKFVFTNTGTINGAFIGTGVRYTKGYENENLFINYYFYDNGTSSGVSNMVTLSAEKNIAPYQAGYNYTRTEKKEDDIIFSVDHTANITVEDEISTNAKQYQSLAQPTNSENKIKAFYDGGTIHLHNRGYVGTSVKSEVAKSGDPSKIPGLSPNDWLFPHGGYPRPKDSTAVALKNVTVRYNGDVIEGTYLDKSKLEFLIEYTNGTVMKLDGNSPDIVFPYGLYVANVGVDNEFYFAYTDTSLTGSRWPEVGYDIFKIEARARRPVEILKVEYNGKPVTENTNYSLSDVRVTVKFDNGSQGVFLGSSSSIGITTAMDPLGDLDGNGVVNSSDTLLLKQFIQGGITTLTPNQRVQADINKDGAINTKDLASLETLLSRKVPYNKKTFYVEYSGVGISKSFTVTSVLRKVSSISIANKPTKIKYIEGEDFEPKGMIVTVRYDNGEFKSMHFKDGTETFDGLSIGSAQNPSVNMPKGQNRIPISYTENGSTKTVWLNISVRQVYLTSIVVAREPNITTYYSGETFDDRGMKINAYYDEGVYNDGRDDDWSRMEEIPIGNCRITGGDKLLDSTNYILVKADQITNQNRNLYGHIRIAKNLITSPTADSLTIGTHTTINYRDGVQNKSVTGTVVGNNYVTISYTENNITKSTIQPIQIEKKKLTKIDVFQMPHKTEYIVGDRFNTSGLIIRAYYTDGTNAFIYEKNESNTNGYEVVNGTDPLPVVSEMTIKYTENGVSALASVPITVLNNEIESVTASYTGPTVDVGRSYVKNFVLINVIYKNGAVDSFYADKQEGGRDAVTIYRKGTTDVDTVIHKDNYENVEMDRDGKFINHFTAIYGGFEADFDIIGVEPIPQLDFSTSVAHGRRDASSWTEHFRSVKMKAVYDYINEYARMGDSGLATIEEKNPSGVVAEQINPLLWFEREGDWVQPVTNFVIEYQSRSSGFLFPETGINADGSIKYHADDYVNMDYSDLPYLATFGQNRDELRNPTNDLFKYAGWSDWVRNGDTVGTVNAKRVAYDYTDDNPTTKSVTMHTDAVKFRLNTANGYTFKADENPMIKIYVNGSTTPYTVTKDTEVEIEDVQTMRMELDGVVRVRNNKGVEELKNFAEMYKVGYKIGTANEPYEWNNQWAGTEGINAECLEAKIQLSTAPIDDFSFASVPYIATQPEDEAAVIGNKAIFTTKAVGQNMSYQWYKINPADNGNMDKAVLIPGATKYYYETPAVTKNDDRTTYYCVVSNGSGETITEQAMLSAVDKLPEILSNLSDQSIVKGQSYTFSIAATCQIPDDLRYQWEMTQDDGTWKVVQPNSANNSYTIIASEDTHNKYIRCKISNSRGSIYSNPARLAAVIDPIVELTANKTTANIGTAVQFTTYVTSYGGVPKYEWYVKNVTENGIYEKVSCEEATYLFTENIPGEYKVKCVVNDTNGYSEDYSTITTNDKNAVSVKIGKPPKVKSITYSVTKTGSENDITGVVDVYKASFSANIDSVSFKGNALKYEWFKNGQAVPGNGNSLTLTGLKENSQVTVMCRVSDGFGKSYQTVQFVVGPIPTTTVQ